MFHDVGCFNAAQRKMHQQWFGQMDKGKKANKHCRPAEPSWRPPKLQEWLQII